METLTQTHETEFDALIARLQNASSETLAEVAALLQGQNEANEAESADETTTENSLENRAIMGEEMHDGSKTWKAGATDEEPTTEELQDEINYEAEPPATDVEEAYKIRAVANEVVRIIEDMQNEIADLKAQLNQMVNQEELEAKVREVVKSAFQGIEI